MKVFDSFNMLIVFLKLVTFKFGGKCAFYAWVLFNHLSKKKLKLIKSYRSTLERKIVPDIIKATICLEQLTNIQEMDGAK